MLIDKKKLSTHINIIIYQLAYNIVPNIMMALDHTLMYITD